MPRPYEPLVPKNVGEIMDLLASMMLSSPTFQDSYFLERNMETEFFALNEGLKLARKKLGEQRYETLNELSHRMRAHFEASPEKDSDDARAGRKLIREMEVILRGG